MKEDKPKSGRRTHIRKQAEEVLKGKTTDLNNLSSGDAQKLVHELEVHEIELEMQNEELRKIQKELEDTRTSYSDLYDFAPIGYFTFDKNGLILQVNLTGAKKLGIERSNLIKKPFSLYIAPDHEYVFYSHLWQVLDTGTQTTCELQLVDKKGNIFDAKLESIPVCESDGNLLVRTAMSDITERKRAEKELESSESRYRRLFEAAQDGILILNANTGEITDVNPFLVSILGYSYEEFIGKELWEFRFFKDIEASKAAFLELQAKGYIRYEDLPLRTKDGRSINVEFVSNVYLVNKKKVIQCNIRDITQRKQMELELESSESRYRRLFEAAQDGILILNFDTEKIADVNPFMINILRYSYEEFVGKELWEIGLLKDIEANKAAFLELQAKGYVRYEDLPLKTKDGRSINVEFVSNVYLVNNKKVIQCNIRDITERKRAENLTKEARIYAESIIDTVREPFVVLDKDLKVLSASRSFYITFEVTPDETVGNLIYNIGNQQWDIPSLRTLLEEILPKDTQFNNYEVTHKFQTIGQKTMLLNARQIYQEVIGTPIILLAIEDITQRKLAEKVSREARIYAESIIDTVREPFVVLDKDLKVLSASRSFYSNFEVTPDETVGNLIYDIGNQQWDIPSLRTLLEEILPKDTQFNNYEVSHKFQTIGQKTMLLNARQIYQEVIGMSMILLAIEDITQRKRTEEELKNYREHLEELVNERTREVRFAKEEAENANMAKTNFLQTMSHELRTPLNAILGFSELLKQKTSGELNEKQERFIDNILKGGNNLQYIIGQILDVVKIYEGKSELRIEKIAVPGTLDEIIGVIKEKATKRNVIFEINLDPQLEHINADKQKFKQVFINLLDNAVKFSKDAGGTVTINAKKEGDMAKFSVSDKGIGIKEEDIGEIFLKFTQLDSGISRKYGGTGIGLSITKQFVELHGGKIHVESKPGMGSTFTFLLPIEAKKKGET